MEVFAAYGYFGLFLAAFLAATILPFSSEIVLSLVLLSGLDPLLCLVVASLGNTLGGMSCYAIGMLGKINWIEKYLRIPYEKVLKMQKWLSGKGSILSILTFLPGIGDIIAVALGFLRVNVFWITLFMLIGKTLRYYVYMSMHNYFFG